MSRPYIPPRRLPLPRRRGGACRQRPDFSRLATIKYLATLTLKLLRHVDDRVALRLFRETYSETFDSGKHITKLDWKAYAINTLELRKSLTQKLTPRNDKDTPGRD